MQSKIRKAQFAIYISARAKDDLVVGKAYQILPDKSAAEVECLRVIDESGEDYLYPESRFVVVNVPPPQGIRLLKAVKKSRREGAALRPEYKMHFEP